MDPHIDYEDEVYWSDNSDDSTSSPVESWEHCEGITDMALDIYSELKEYLSYQRCDILKYMTAESVEELLVSTMGLPKAEWTEYEELMPSDLVIETKLCPEAWVEVSGRELNDIHRIFAKYDLHLSKPILEMWTRTNSALGGYARV